MLRKTDQRRVVDRPRLIASMRPQRNAAENGKIAIMSVKTTIASMRPQGNAAENVPVHASKTGRYIRASMRPQRNAAKNRETR